MYGLHVRNLVKSCALVVLSCMVALSAAAERRVAQAGEEDETLSTAERITYEGLLAGIAGAAESRDAALRRATSTAPEYGLARWHSGQFRVGDEWLTIAQSEERMAEDAQLAECRELRKAVLGNPQREKR